MAIEKLSKTQRVILEHMAKGCKIEVTENLWGKMDYCLTYDAGYSSILPATFRKLYAARFIKEEYARPMLTRYVLTDTGRLALNGVES